MSTAFAGAELLAAVLPITALQVSEIAGRCILLAGVGCYLKVIHADTRASISSRRVFKCHAIHGIVPLGLPEIQSETGCDQARLDVIIYGGRQLAWVVFNLTLRDKTVICSSLDIIDTALARDWILCCKGSDTPRSHAVFVTSYNALYSLQANKATGQLKCQVLADSIGIFLYSATVTERYEKSYLIASGTVFGQVLTWLCEYDEDNQVWKVTSLIQFDGHHGSIFGVDISQPRFTEGKEFRDVLSCSDDRMICIWKLPGIDVNTSHSRPTISTDFQQCTQMLVKAYGHLSRIWNVSISQFQHCGYTEPFIVSAGEDGQVQSWALQRHGTIESHTWSLEKRYLDRHHFGKNIWAQCCLTRKDLLTFTSGGADGQIISRRYDGSGRADIDSRHTSESFKIIQTGISGQSLSKAKPLVLKSHIAIDSSYLLATTDTGHLLRYRNSADNPQWEVVVQDPKFVPLASSSTVVAEHLFFIRTSDHTLCTIATHGSTSIEICRVREGKIANVWTDSCSQFPALPGSRVCVAVSYHGSNRIDLYWIVLMQEKAELLGRTSVLLPAAFEVTSLLYDHDLQTLLCGSRGGALALSTKVSETTIDARFQLCTRRVHGHDSVTSISRIETEQQQQQAYYLTTGKDGTYCMHKLILTEAQKPCLTVVHQVLLPIGPSIEGAYTITRPDGSRGLLLYGFHSKNFVVWDEISQTQVMNIDCGGAHRSWMFSPDLVTGQGGTFVYTKAATFIFCQQNTLDHEIIQPGGHGREIKALAAHQLGHHRWLLATGSEDTDIRLFQYSSDSELRNIMVLRRHTTGLQDLHFSSDGRVLISAAGMEELYAWYLAPVPLVDQGVVFACASTSLGGQSDARIMSIDIRVVRHDQAKHTSSHLVTAAYSNGKMKVLQLSSLIGTAETNFTLLQTFDFGTICLTQAHFCPTSFIEPQSTNTIIVGATNGSVRICNVASLVEGPSDTSLAASPGFSNNAILPFHHRLHQNSITALQTLQIDSKHHLLVTGGDDNALIITLVTSSPSATPSYTYKSLMIPNAHAAALTALHLLKPKSNYPTSSVNNHIQHFRVITAGNDQRVQAWSITVDTSIFSHDAVRQEPHDEKHMTGVQMDWLGEWYTDVADISAMDVLSGSEDEEDGRQIEDTVNVIVVGVGMEVLRLDLSKGQ